MLRTQETSMNSDRAVGPIRIATDSRKQKQWGLECEFAPLDPIKQSVLERFRGHDIYHYKTQGNCKNPKVCIKHRMKRDVKTLQKQWFE